MRLRPTYFCAALLLVFLLLVACAAAADKGAGFTFVQIADTQLGWINSDRDMVPEIDHFRKAVEAVNRLKPAFVVISGDMINRAHDPKQIREFWRIAKQISPSIPLYLVPGNHDVGEGAASDVRSYEKLFGKDHYSFVFQGSSFIVLDTSLIHYPKSDDALRAAQRKWFEEQLAAAKAGGASHIFVLTHHPWFLGGPEEADDYSNIPQTERHDYLALMQRYGVDFALAGHYHREAFARAGGLSMITTGALSRNFSADPAGFRVFKVYKDRVEHTYYPLDRVPEHIAP